MRPKDWLQSQTVPVDPGRAVQAGRDISGIASTGDHVVNVQNRAERMTVLPAEAFRPITELIVPPGLANLPARMAMFVGRAAELARLDEALARSDDVVVQAVHGLGGIGKSTLAAHWAAAHAADYSLIWWITADTPTGIDAGLADLAVALQPALSGVLPSEILRERAIQWLTAHQDWLIILDNVTDPADVAPLLGRVMRGRYLITSRRATGWHNLAVPVRLDVLDPAEAMNLLTAILAQHTPLDLKGTDELCAELGYLPLAIEQAGGYLTETGTTLREYLRLLARYPAEMYQAAAEGGDAARTIGRIWDITLDRLAGEPLIGQVLRILAWYAPDGIPRTLLDGLAEPPAVMRAIGRLAAYSMLTADETDLAVHRLVQAVARTPTADDPHRNPQAVEEARDQAIRQLAAALPDLQQSTEWPAWRNLLPHIDALANHIPPDTDTEAVADILGHAGASLIEQGRFTRAAENLQRVLAYSKRVLGSDHPNTLLTCTNLATAYREAGDLSRAIPMFEQVLADSERVLGSEHPDTLATRSNLAIAYHEAGDLSRAIPLLQQVLADSERVPGSDHPNTLVTRSSLGNAYREAGDLSRAIPLLQQVLADSERVLGSDHPNTLVTRNNLASAYRAAGDLGRAIPLFEQVLADSERVLGSHHPTTLATRNNLASAYQEAGDLSRAIPLLQQVLADSERVLGSHHSQTLASRTNLASAYQEAGDLSRAIPLLQQVLADSERVLGSHHSQTLASRTNLASAYQEAGDLSRAIPLLQQAVADSERVLGSDHPETLTARSKLGSAYRAAGKPSRAMPLLQQALADSERVLGGDDPTTLLARNNLATAYQEAGDSAGRFPCLSRPSPTASGSWAATTPTPSSPATISPTHTRTPETPSGRFPCLSRPSPTASGSWAATTPPPSSPAAISATPTARRGTWAGQSPC